MKQNIVQMVILALQYARIVQAANNFVDGSFHRHENIVMGLDMHWKVHTVDEVNTIDIIFRTSFAWIGFGMAEPSSGTMMGSDIVTLYTSSNSGPTISDRFSTKEGYPELDCQQDWILISSSMDQNETVYHIRRKLNTNDTQDHAIVDNDFGTRVIFAHGPENLQYVNDISYHGNNRFLRRINFFNFSSMQPLDKIQSDISVRSIELIPAPLVVPVMETVYHDFCFEIADFSEPGNLFNESSIIAFEAKLLEQNRKYIHHFILSAHEESSCHGHKDIIWAWAPGSQPFILPEDVGFPVKGYKSIKMQVHYDNLYLDNIVDSSGVKIYFKSHTLHEAGSLSIGDIPMGQSIPVGFSQYEFHCDTNDMDGRGMQLDSDISIFSLTHHMHQSGQAMQTKIYRNNSLILNSEVQYYDFDYQAGIDIKPFKLKRGDNLFTTCSYYHDGSTDLKFGLGSRDEMCIDFLFYYPKSSNQYPYICGWQRDDPMTTKYLIRNGTIVDESALGRILGEKTCTSTPTDKITVSSSTATSAKETTSSPCRRRSRRLAGSISDHLPCDLPLSNAMQMKALQNLFLFIVIILS